MTSDEHQADDESDDESGIWVTSSPDARGRYQLNLEISKDDVIPLNVIDAWGWVREASAALAAAEYDVAVLVQMTEGLGIGLVEAVQFVSGLRADRPAYRYMAKIGLRLVPGVSERTGEAFLAIERNGRVIGQWERAEVLEHVQGMIEVICGLELDTGYYRFLADTLHLDGHRPAQVVGDLAQWRGRPAVKVLR